jgi:hypothetical protein
VVLSLAEAAELASRRLNISIEQAGLLVTAAYRDGQLRWTVDDSYIEAQARAIEASRVPAWMPPPAPGEEWLEILAESASYGALRSCILDNVPADVAKFDEDAFRAWLDKQVTAQQQPAVSQAPEPEAEPHPEPAPPKRTRSSDRRPVRRGPRAEKFKRVVQQMRHNIDAGKLTLDALANTSEKVLAVHYDVSRDTVRKARDEVDPNWSERRK